MPIEDALQDVLRRALIHDGLARGLRECVKALDRYSIETSCGLYVEIESAELLFEFWPPLFEVTGDRRSIFSD